MSLIASIDCGTTSTRFIVFNEKADVLAVEQQEFKQIYEKPGWHAQDPDAMVSSCLSCIDKAVTKLEESGKGKASDIAAIGITNQRETTVVWSRKTGKALCDAIAWPDTRTTHTVRQLAGKSDKGADALKHITGLPLSTYFAGVKLRWLLDNNETVRKAHDDGDLMFGTVDTWLLYRFTGGVDGGLFLTDCVNASRTMLMDIRKLEWSDECLDYFGFDKRILAKIVSNSEVYGELSADCKLKGIKIAGMIGDQQGAMTGQKCFRKGETKNTYGTGCFMLFNTGEEVVPSSHGLLTTVAYKAGKDAKPIYALEGSIAVAGSAIQWVRDKLELIKSAPEIGELASQVEDTGGVYFVTGFSGLFAPYWDDTATGCLIGISAYTDKRHIARATIESVCFQTKAILDAMGADSGAKLTALRVDGGMTNSDIAMQIQADILGLTVDRPKMRESTALGSAIMAGHAIGFHDWDVTKPESLDAVNTAGLDEFKPVNSDEDRAKRYAGWNRAVLRSKAWKETE